jgi:hypothetical protein
MIYRLVVGVLAALAVAIIVPVQAHAEPPVKCLTNTQKGKQVYVPWAALPSTARSVPERCGRLVWRRARPCESHTHESYDPNDPNEPYQSHDPNESYQSHESGQPIARAQVDRTTTR